MKMYKSPYKEIDNRKYNTWCKYQKRIDTYGNGCEHECHYCYAKSLLNFRGHWNSSALPSSISEIHYKIKKLKRGDIVRMGSMTDCFQPCELKYSNTYNTIKLLNHYGMHYLIVTKSNIVSMDKYIEIYNKNLAHFQVTITSTDDNYSSKFEKASLISQRIESIEKLASYGFDVSIRLSPFMFENVNYNILNSIKCYKILIEFLKVNHFIRKTFNIDYSQYTHKYGGYDNLELKNKIEILKNVTGFKQISIGEYVKEHFEYFNENLNYNKNDCCNLNYSIPKEECKQLKLF